MAKLFKKRNIQIATTNQIATTVFPQKNVYDTVLEKMQVAISTEIEDPNGRFNAIDLGRLQKELYGRKPSEVNGERKLAS